VTHAWEGATSNCLFPRRRTLRRPNPSILHDSERAPVGGYPTKTRSINSLDVWVETRRELGWYCLPEIFIGRRLESAVDGQAAGPQVRRQSVPRHLEAPAPPSS
jgi:hypothetical protein